MLSAIAIGLFALFHPLTGPTSTGINHTAATTVTDCTAPVPNTVTVTNTLTIVTSQQDFPQLTSTTVIVVPDTWSGAVALRADPYGTTFRSAIGCLLPTYQSDYRAHTPTVTESKGSITVTDEVTTVRDPFGPSGAYDLGLWHIEPSRLDIKLSFANVSWTIFPATWTITVNSGGLPARGWSTKPASDTSNDPNGAVTWAPQATSAAAQTSLTLAWPTRFNHDQALGRWPLKSLAEAAWSIAGLVVFIPPWRLFRRYRKEHRAAVKSASPPPDDQLGRMHALRRVCIAGLTATALIIVDDLACDTTTWGIFTDPIYDLFPRDRVADSDILATLEVFALLVFSGWLFISSWRWGRGFWPIVICTVLVIDAACMIQASPQLYSSTPSPIGDLIANRLSLTRSAFSAQFIAVSLIPLVVIVFLTCAGTVGYVLTLWPADKQGSPWAPAPPRRNLIAALATVLAVAGAIVFQVALSAHDDGRKNGVLGNDRGNGSANWMMRETLAAPHWFIGELPNLLFFPAAVGVLALLWQASRSGQGGVFFAGSSKGTEVRALAYLLAAVGVGTWGENATLKVPIAFMVTYLLIRTVIVSKRLETLEGRLVEHASAPRETGTTGRLTKYQTALLAAAEQRVGLQRKLTKLEHDTSSPEAQDTRTTRQATADELKRLTRTWELPQPASRPQGGWLSRTRQHLLGAAPMRVESIEVPHGDKDVNPAHVALSLGPEASWWANGWRAARLALLPSLLTTGYYTYRGWHYGLLWPMDYRFGLVNDINQEVGIAAGWLATAFAFGCLYPYLRGSTGPIKGAVLGVTLSVGLAADALPTYALDAPRYNLFLLDGIINVVFLALVGLLVDSRTLAHHNRNLSWIFELYHLSTFRVAATYSLTVVIALVGIWQQAHAGNQLDQQRAQIITTISKQLQHPGGS